MVLVMEKIEAEILKKKEKYPFWHWWRLETIESVNECDESLPQNHYEKGKKKEYLASFSNLGIWFG